MFSNYKSVCFTTIASPTYIQTDRAVDCWNSLPNEIVNAEYYAAFARKIKQLDLSEFLKGMS